MEIKEMSIDLETYSDRDIQKCGAYKYAESGQFEILLFGVSTAALLLSTTWPAEIPSRKKSLMQSQTAPLSNGHSMPHLSGSASLSGSAAIIQSTLTGTVSQKILPETIWIHHPGSAAWSGLPVSDCRSPLPEPVLSSACRNRN